MPIHSAISSTSDDVRIHLIAINKEGEIVFQCSFASNQTEPYKEFERLLTNTPLAGDSFGYATAAALHSLIEAMYGPHMTYQAYSILVQARG